MDGRGPVCTTARTLSTTDRFVISPATHHLTTPLHVARRTLPAERDVVHGSLALGGHGNAAARQRKEQRVHDPLRRLDIPRGDGARVTRVHETPLGRRDAH